MRISDWSSACALPISYALGGRPLRYFDFCMAGFVAILLLSNLIGAAKLSTLGGFTFGAGILFFPLGYVLGDVLTEVYGYARARRCVWAGFGAMLFMALDRKSTRLNSSH